MADTSKSLFYLWDNIDKSKGSEYFSMEAGTSNLSPFAATFVLLIVLYSFVTRHFVRKMNIIYKNGLK